MTALLSYLTTELGLAENTIEAYRSDLELFTRHLDSRAVKLNAFGTEDISSFVVAESSRGRATKTIRRRLAAIRSLLCFQATCGRNVERILLCIDPPKNEGRQLPNVLGRGETLQLLFAPRGQLADRDTAILEFMYATGLRASELCGLRKSNLNVGERWVRINGKGGKERVVPIGQAAVESLARYWSHRDTGEFVFASVSGKPLCRHALKAIVKRAHRRSRLHKHVSPHTLRHCFASHMLSGGANFRVVQELLGHADVNTTMVYTHVDFTRLKKVHALLGR
jgi:integrase/recombinase XerD